MECSPLSQHIQICQGEFRPFVWELRAQNCQEEKKNHDLKQKTDKQVNKQKSQPTNQTNKLKPYKDHKGNIKNRF